MGVVFTKANSSQVKLSFKFTEDRNWRYSPSIIMAECLWRRGLKCPCALVTLLWNNWRDIYIFQLVKHLSFPDKMFLVRSWCLSTWDHRIAEIEHAEKMHPSPRAINGKKKAITSLQLMRSGLVLGQSAYTGGPGTIPNPYSVLALTAATRGWGHPYAETEREREGETDEEKQIGKNKRKKIQVKHLIKNKTKVLHISSWKLRFYSKNVTLRHIKENMCNISISPPLLDE